MSTLFEAVFEAPPVEIFAISEACKKDPDSHKVNLSVGAYRTDEGKPWVLPVVEKVEQLMVADKTLNKEYLPITGIEKMCTAATKLVLGADNELIKAGKVGGCQALGGTGAIYLALQFLKRVSKCENVYVSHPTWPNHKAISHLVGLKLFEYRYWDPQSRKIDFKGMMEDIEKAPEGSIFIFHACAHNPTGVDPTHDQWKQIASMIKLRKLFPLFDIAYQGFASGDLEADAWVVRYFAEFGLEMFITQSFSKNFGLYNERVGNLVFVAHHADIKERVQSQIKILARCTWSNPPLHGAFIVNTVLNTPALYEEWKGNVLSMAERVKRMRNLLHAKLLKQGTPGSWDHVTTQIGMFSFTGLTAKQSEQMRLKHHIYLTSDGRINICGITDNNVEDVAHAIDDVVRTCN